MCDGSQITRSRYPGATGWRNRLLVVHISVTDRSPGLSTVHGIHGRDRSARCKTHRHCPTGSMSDCFGPFTRAPWSTTPAGKIPRWIGRRSISHPKTCCWSSPAPGATFSTTRCWGPKRIHAVDANPRQTALLELKVAGVRGLEFDDFFSVFGEGCHPAFPTLYNRYLREQLSDFARGYWISASSGSRANAVASIFTGCPASWPAASKPTWRCARVSAATSAPCSAPARSTSSALYMMSASPRRCGVRRCDGRCRVSLRSASWVSRIPNVVK